MPDLATARSWYRVTSRRIDEAGVRLYSAAIAYRTIFSLLAFLSTIVLVVRIAGVDAAELRATGDLGSGASDDLAAIAKERAARTLELDTSSVVVAGLLGLVFGLYGMSGGFAAICDVLDRIHGTHRYRRLSIRYLRGAGVACVFTVFAVIAVGALLLTTAFGEYVLDLLGLELLEGPLRLLLGFALPLVSLPFAFAFVLRYGSHARPPAAEVITGAIVASVSAYTLFFAFLGFATLVRPFEAYGAFATSVALLLFGYAQAYLLILTALFGPELAFVGTLGHERFRQRRERAGGA